MAINPDLIAHLESLPPRQLARVEQLVDALNEGTTHWRNPVSDFVSDDFCDDFGDQLRLHHNASAIPLTKDKFEYAMVSTLKDTGHEAEKVRNGNPGEDVTCDGVPWSLKTQANRNIRNDKIHISKFMELGKGPWETVTDVEDLRRRMFEHMTKYDRIFTLRCLSRISLGDGLGEEPGIAYEYELVEIPKTLLHRAANFPIRIKASEQNPKPASCDVTDESGSTRLFELYFDGGTERKLQVRNLLKSQCVVHATWTFTAAE